MHGMAGAADQLHTRTTRQNAGRRETGRKSPLGIVINIAIVVAALGSISLALYPTIANTINQIGQNRDITVYTEAVREADTTALDAMWTEAEDYNEALAARGSLFQLTSDEQAAYETLLNVSGDGLMGYVDIPGQDIHLAIYHGTDDTVLDTAVGHLAGTSLPTDGTAVHSVITGHTGLPNLDLFTDIQEMAVGDTFTITVLNRVLTYTVDRIDVVLPEDVYTLGIDENANHCTLVTCTPYGVNDHRLLVRGTLTGVGETDLTEVHRQSHVYAAYGTTEDALLRVGCTALIVIGAVILLVIGITYYRSYRKGTL